MENQQGLENITGQMEAISKEHSKVPLDNKERFTLSKEDNSLVIFQKVEIMFDKWVVVIF